VDGWMLKRFLLKVEKLNLEDSKAEVLCTVCRRPSSQLSKNYWNKKIDTREELQFQE
jgi:hypothetical protein